MLLALPGRFEETGDRSQESRDRSDSCCWRSLGDALAEGGRGRLADRAGGSLGGQDAAQEGRRLVEGLLVLEGRVGVGDDAAAGLDVDDAVLDQRRPERDRRLELAVPVEQADRARIGPTAVLLEL